MAADDQPCRHRALCLAIGGLFLCQALLGFYLYRYILRVEASLPAAAASARSKRETADNNALFKDESVEFFNPKLRGDLEEKDRAQMNATGAQQDNPWVWLTSYSRIPLVAIQGFCSATKEYCPPGVAGPPGSPGETGKRGEQGSKGDRGERGLTGDTGSRGPPGAPGDPGPRGLKGEPGPQGSSGLDGRDGVPGEPGLDGMPGRNGRDGLPGLSGAPGIDGTPGKPGYNGTDGIPGKMGSQGPQGPPGPRGLTGPRGKPGKPGINGTPGKPGVQAYEVTVNGTKTSELLMPPTIIGSEAIFAAGPIVVQEGDNVRLRCAATGYPMPTVKWKKVDKTNRITQGKWQESSIVGNTLNMTRVNREHMGTYMCIASNGLAPPAKQSFDLEVHFPPFIQIEKQHIAGTNGSTVTLQCLVEAYPDALKYWERADGRAIENNDKYNTSITETSSYGFKMELNISRLNYLDYGKYHCLTKNELGYAKGLLTLYELRPGMSAPTSQGGPGEGGLYGKPPPERLDLDDICPPPVPCPECPDPKEFKCRQGIYSLYDLLGHRDLEVLPLDRNKTYPGVPNRTLDCQVYAVGKPVYHRFTDAAFGSWMRDAHPRTDADSEKYWVTKENDKLLLYEFPNKTEYRKDTPSKIYKLQYPFVGNAHLIYNGSFFYNHKSKPQIVKFDLQTEISQLVQVPYASVNESNYLYTTMHNYMDFSLDDNGLWVIYGLPGTNNTAVIKVDAYSLEIQYAWNVSLKHQKAGEMFIVCGVLYVVDSTTDRRTNIRFALDLFKNHLLEDVSIEFTNPFRRTTMIGYNHRAKELYTWDKGNQLTYPIRYHEIGYNNTKEEKGEPEANAISQTGFDIF